VNKNKLVKQKFLFLHAVWITLSNDQMKYAYKSVKATTIFSVQRFYFCVNLRTRASRMHKCVISQPFLNDILNSVFASLSATLLTREKDCMYV